MKSILNKSRRYSLRSRTPPHADFSTARKKRQTTAKASEQRTKVIKRTKPKTSPPQSTTQTTPTPHDHARCFWAPSPGTPMAAYHDLEWGNPVHCDRELFEFLTLEGAQAGLSWNTILNKREGYREAFDNFQVDKIVRYDEAAKLSELMDNAGIVRNRLKILSVMNNAKMVIQVRSEFGSFDNYLWGFMPNSEPIVNSHTRETLPAKDEISEAMSKDMKKRGFKFVGPTIMYAFMQACGMVNDHTVDCFRHPDYSTSNKATS